MNEKPTPRTDANVAALTKAPDCYCEAEFARQLERENQTFRAAQKACEDCDAPRVDRIDELERELHDLKAILQDPVEVELAMIRGNIAIPHRHEFDAIRATPCDSPPCVCGFCDGTACNYGI